SRYLPAWSHSFSGHDRRPVNHDRGGGVRNEYICKVCIVVGRSQEGVGFAELLGGDHHAEGWIARTRIIWTHPGTLQRTTEHEGAHRKGFRANNPERTRCLGNFHNVTRVD